MKNKILIGILYNNEPQFNECLYTLKNQTFKSFDYFIIKNKPNKEAHIELYDTFTKNEKYFNTFLKLDADMVLLTNDKLQEIYLFSQKNNFSKTLTFQLIDTISEKLIWGLHIFPNTSKWIVNDDLFVDPTPYNVKRKKVYKAPSPVAVHMPEPTKFQAYKFGVHRTLKMLQVNRKKKKPLNALQQYLLLKSIYKNFFLKSDIIKGFVILGIMDIIFSNYKSNQYSSKEFEKKFSEYENYTVQDIFNKLEILEKPFLMERTLVKNIFKL